MCVGGKGEIDKGEEGFSINSARLDLPGQRDLENTVTQVTSAVKLL